MTEGRDYYVYIYFHPKRGEPVYVGKGRGKRAVSHRSDTHNLFLHHFLRKYPDVSPVECETDLSEAEAYRIEKQLIRQFGRVSEGTGPLFNVLEGGEDEASVGMRLKYRGKEYLSIKALARDYGIEEGTFWSRVVRLEWSLDEATEVIARKTDRTDIRHVEIAFRSQTFPNRAALARAYNVDPRRFHARLMSGWSLPEALGLVKRKRPRYEMKAGKTITCDGKTYNSIKSLAEAFEVDLPLVRDRFRLGWTPEEAVGLKARAQAGKKTHPIVVFGDEFPSVEALSRDPRVKMTSETIRRRLRKGLTVDEAVSVEAYDPSLQKNAEPIQSHPLWNPITVRGVRYRSHREVALKHGVPPRVFEKRLLKGWSLEEALGLKPRPRKLPTNTKPITIAGKYYPSRRAAAEAFRIDPRTMNSRLFYGWTPEEAAGLRPRRKKRVPIPIMIGSKN